MDSGTMARKHGARMRGGRGGRGAWVRAAGAVALMAVAACGSGTGPDGRAGSLASARDPDPRARFWSRLSARCGQAFAGTMASRDAADADLLNRPLRLHVARCAEDEIRISFQVGPAAKPSAVAGAGEGARPVADREPDRDPDGWDRSRTWVLRRADGRLSLSHDHRHRDGSPDRITGYGGATVDGGTAGTQRFPVDAASQALFRRTDRAVSVTNVWTIDIAAPGETGATLSYMLTRPAPNARLFRAVFDLTRPIAPPPPSWGRAADAVAR